MLQLERKEHGGCSDRVRVGGNVGDAGTTLLGIFGSTSWSTVLSFYPVGRQLLKLGF